MCKPQQLVPQMGESFIAAFRSDNKAPPQVTETPMHHLSMHPNTLPHSKPVLQQQHSILMIKKLPMMPTHLLLYLHPKFPKAQNSRRNDELFSLTCFRQCVSWRQGFSRWRWGRGGQREWRKSLVMGIGTGQGGEVCWVDKIIIAVKAFGVVFYCGGFVCWRAGGLGN